MSLWTEVGAAQAIAQSAVTTDSGLAEIIVTATRRSESLQNVASQVTALTGATWIR